MVKQGFPEILAPAGSMESLYAALHAKADAVYFGGKMLSARAYAGNFGREEIIEAVSLAHQHKAKAYYTLNTLIKNQELKLLEEIGDTVSMAGVDALIIQDFGAYLFFKRYYPELALHASTQMTVHSTAGAKRLYDLGFERIVLSRELSLQEVKEIIKEVPIEVETFVHGAMCYCYSGQCQMSAAYGERSANRGKCAQPCRLSYSVDEKQGYLLSLKDQMTLEHIPKLMEAGIHSLKIEGRMKNPEYVYTIASVYRKYRDLALSGMPYAIDKRDIQRMNEVFSRGQTSAGYYFVRKSGNMIFPEQPKTSKLTNAKTLAELSFVRNKPEQKEAIYLYFCAKENQPLELTVSLKDNPSICYTEKGAVAQKAEKKAVKMKDVEKPLKQTGDTPYIVEHIAMDLADNLFIPVSHIKEIRRNALENLGKYRQGSPSAKDTELESKVFQIELPPERVRSKYDNPEISVLIRTTRQLEIMLDSVADTIYFEWSFLDCGKMIQVLREKLTSQTVRKKFYLVAPTILRNDEWLGFWRDYQTAKAFFQEHGSHLGIFARTGDYLDVFKQDNPDVRLDYSLNIWNQLAYEFYTEHDRPSMIALGNEISYASRSQLGDFEMVVYGKLATMHTANCLSNANSKLPNRFANPKCKIGALETLDYITDRKGASIGYHRNCKSCSNTLYNPIPLFLVDQTIPHAKSLRFELLDETEEELQTLVKIIRQRKEGISPIINPFANFTRGHFSKGVE